MRLLTLVANLGYALAGYPLFFASFEDVGESIVDTEVRPFEVIDDQVTAWLTSCWSDVFIIIKDSNPVDPSDLYRLKRFAQQARTTGTFVTDYPLQMNDLADDVSVHCKAPLKKIDIYATYPIEQELNQRRTYYVEFDATDRVEKSVVLEKILARLTSPFVTIIYTSSFGVPQPIFQNIEPDPKRDVWSTHYVDYHAKPQYKEPVVAPIVEESERKRRTQPKAQLRKEQEARRRAAQYSEYLSDRTFAAMFLFAVFSLLLKLAWDGLVALFLASKSSEKQTAKAAAKSRQSRKPRQNGHPKLVEPVAEPTTAKTTESESLKLSK